LLKSNRLWDGNYQDYLDRLGLEENDGSMGRIYGVQWRKWQGANGKVVDQLQDAIDLIKHNPESRRILVNAWNAAEIDLDVVALPPCHNFFQFHVAENKLSLQMYQRSCDMFLGVPLNIASYSVLLHMVAKITNLVPHEFIHVLGDAHIYLNHLDAVKEQLSRKPYPLPHLHIKDRGQSSIEDFEMDDFELINYQHHPTIKAMMAV
jgi:thymidylate synthase